MSDELPITVGSFHFDLYMKHRITFQMEYDQNTSRLKLFNAAFNITLHKQLDADDAEEFCKVMFGTGVMDTPYMKVLVNSIMITLWIHSTLFKRLCHDMAVGWQEKAALETIKKAAKVIQEQNENVVTLWRNHATIH